MVLSGEGVEETASSLEAVGSREEMDHIPV